MVGGEERGSRDMYYITAEWKNLYRVMNKERMYRVMKSD